LNIREAALDADERGRMNRQAANPVARLIAVVLASPVLAILNALWTRSIALGNLLVMSVVAIAVSAAHPTSTPLPSANSERCGSVNNEALDGPDVGGVIRFS
jgi:hypothetical protein